MRVTSSLGVLRVISFVFFVVHRLLVPSLAQSQSLATVTTEDKTPAGSIALNTGSTVSNCIKVEAVLIPREPAAKLFSGYVARNYAVVKTTISNHCDQQQFILHDIFFDYSDWALSGVYKQEPGTKASCQSSPTPAKTASCTGKDCVQTTTVSPQAEDCCAKSATPCDTDTWKQGTKPGQVATVGATDIQDQVTEDSVFSKRNLVVNGLTLVGQVAGGYAFVGAAAAAQGIGAYNSAFVPNLGKFWPDRRLDQEKFLLSLGYRTDQSTAIAKDDHGSYYAFFPLSTFLIPDLKKLFLDDPAVFLNPAEAWLEPGALKPSNLNESTSRKHHQREDLAELRSFIWELAKVVHGPGPFTQQELLVQLSAKCEDGDCPICLAEQTVCPQQVQAEKTLFRKASLNSGKVVVRGVMTVDLDDVPPIINSVAFDGEKSGGSYWTVSETPPAAADSKSGSTATGSPTKGGSPAKPTVKTLSGTATGKFLSNATIAAVTIDDPKVSNADINDYLDKASTKTDNSHSSDTTLAFSIGLTKTLLAGTQLTFQASRTAPNSSSGTSVQATSSKYVYKVSYDALPGNPSITTVTMDKDATVDIWQTPGKLSGTVIGSNLAGGTVSIASLTIAGKAAKVTDYIGTIDSVPGTSDASKLDFKLALLKAVPDGSKLSFVVSTTAGDKATPSQPDEYTVTKPKAAAAKPPAEKAANKAKKKI